MSYKIEQSTLTSELKKVIYEGFHEASLRAVGYNGLGEEPVSFVMYEEDTLNMIGCVVVQMFWGQLHIKYLLVDEKYRSQGYARTLMEQTFAYAKTRSCDFVFVETLSIQAPQFYQKLGFEIEFTRPGFHDGISFHYLKKEII